ncbi:MAG: formate dehydrogenase subunit alpha [Anaerolineaceae bacterium]|nr:formate dehydrogenase subunit alpha [Anaerolineaceae bacterium]
MNNTEKTVSTICPYCGVGCNLELHIEENFIKRVTSPFDNVVNQGNLCVKGRFGYDFVYSPERVTKPLLRKTPQKPGKRTQAFDRSEWVEVSWDEALDFAADRMVEIYKREGSNAMAAYLCAKATNEDNYLGQKLIRSLFRSNHIDHCTRLCHAGSVVGLNMALGSMAMSNTAAEVIESDVIILTGSNTTETHPIIGLQMKAAVEKHGLKIIVVDPRRIEMVNHAQLWLPEKPGSDVAVFSAMAHVIIKEKLYNTSFMEERTEGFEVFAESMKKFTPEFAESVSGVDPNLIIEAARLYATAEKAAIYWALGISQSSHGTDNALALVNLALLTGQVGRSGTGLNPLRGQNNVQGASDAGAMPFHYPGYQEVDREENALKFEKAWNIEPGGLNREPGLTTTEILSAAGEGGIESLFIMGENPMMSEPNLNHAHQQIQQLEFIAAQDLFINESGAYADVFFPSCSWAEKDGTFTNTDRRIQRVYQAIEPIGEARPDWQILSDLAKRIEARLGREKTSFWDYAHPSAVFNEMRSVMPAYAGVTYDRLQATGLQNPVPTTDHSGTPFLFEESFPRGRGLFHALNYIAIDEEPDEAFPFMLTTGRVLEHWHGGTLTRHSWMDDLFPEALVEVYPDDAEALKIMSGDAVRVSSRRGSIVLRAVVTTKTTPGVVFIPFAFAEAAANYLTNDVLDPLAKIPEFKACAVKLESVSESDLPNPDRKQKRGRY